jgi:hypothetical protein
MAMGTRGRSVARSTALAEFPRRQVARQCPSQAAVSSGSAACSSAVVVHSGTPTSTPRRNGACSSRSIGTLQPAPSPTTSTEPPPRPPECDRRDRPRRSTHRQRRPEGARPAPRPGMTTCRRGCCPCPWPAPRRRAEGRVGGAKKARPHRAFRCSRNRRSPRPPLAGHPGRFTGRAATSHPSLPDTRSYGDVLRRV